MGFHRLYPGDVKKSLKDFKEKNKCLFLKLTIAKEKRVIEVR